MLEYSFQTCYLFNYRFKGIDLISIGLLLTIVNYDKNNLIKKILIQVFEFYECSFFYKIVDMNRQMDDAKCQTTYQSKHQEYIYIRALANVINTLLTKRNGNILKL